MMVVGRVIFCALLNPDRGTLITASALWIFQQAGVNLRPQLIGCSVLTSPTFCQPADQVRGAMQIWSANIVMQNNNPHAKAQGDSICTRVDRQHQHHFLL